MSKISNEKVYLNVKKNSVGGFQNPTLGKPERLVDNNKDKGKVNAQISQDEMIVMEEYAKYLPRGKRQLKLNVKELRNTVLANDLMATPLTKTSGLNRGGNLSLVGGKPKEQKEYLYTIQNKNKLPNNPNPTSFKNNFKI
jgi:hypothetical protein